MELARRVRLTRWHATLSRPESPIAQRARTGGSLQQHESIRNESQPSRPLPEAFGAKLSLEPILAASPATEATRSAKAMARRWARWLLPLAAAAAQDLDAHTRGSNPVPRFLFTSHKLPLEQMPDALRDNIERWRNLNPSFAFKYFDDQEQDAVMRELCEALRPRGGFGGAVFAGRGRGTAAGRFLVIPTGGNRTKTDGL